MYHAHLYPGHSHSKTKMSHKVKIHLASVALTMIQDEGRETSCYPIMCPTVVAEVIIEFTTLVAGADCRYIHTLCLHVLAIACAGHCATPTPHASTNCFIVAHSNGMFDLIELLTLYKGGV